MRNLCVVATVLTVALLAAPVGAGTAPAVVWERALGGSLDDGFGGVSFAEGGFVLSGSTASNDGNVSGNHGQTDAWVVKVDRNGQPIWQRPLGGSGSESGGRIEPAGGGFILGAAARSADGDVTLFRGGVDAWAVRIDGAGRLDW